AAVAAGGWPVQHRGSPAVCGGRSGPARSSLCRRRRRARHYARYLAPPGPLRAPPAALRDRNRRGRRLSPARRRIRSQRLGDEDDGDPAAGLAVAHGPAPNRTARPPAPPERGPSAQQMLAELTGIDATNLVAVLNSLEDEGLIERRRDCAGRRRAIIALPPRVSSFSQTWTGGCSAWTTRSSRRSPARSGKPCMPCSARPSSTSAPGAPRHPARAAEATGSVAGPRERLFSSALAG